MKLVSLVNTVEELLHQSWKLSLTIDHRIELMARVGKLYPLAFGAERDTEVSLLVLILQNVEADNLIAVVGSSDFGTLLEGTEFELLKLDCELVDLKFVLGSFGEVDLELDRDNVSEWVATWSFHGKFDVINFGPFSEVDWLNCEWNRNLD